jgi:hypothetical protein
MGIIYAQRTHGLPDVLAHLLNTLPALPRVSAVLTLRFIPLPYVTDDERFLVRRSDVAGVYRVVARYGYMEEVAHGPHFVRQLVGCLVRHVAGEGVQIPEDPQAEVGGTGSVLIHVPADDAPGHGDREPGDGEENWAAVPTSVLDDDALMELPGAGARVIRLRVWASKGVGSWLPGTVPSPARLLGAGRFPHIQPLKHMPQSL